MNTRLQLLNAFFAIALVLTAAADPPPTGDEPPQIRGRTFVPNAGYIGTVKRQQLKRELAARRAVQGAPPVGALKGTRLLPVICVSFNNAPPPFPAADYQKLLFGTVAKQKTMTQYYSDISNGKLHVTGTVLGWYKLPKNDTFYENGQEGGGPPFGDLLKFALETADAEIDFGQFDNDGPDGVPNSGDDDGKVDTVVIIHSDYGGECEDGTHHIWSHQWHYTDEKLGHSGPYVTRAIRRDDALGKPMLGADGKPEHIVVEDYVIQPGLSCPKPGVQKKIIQVGVFCHEYGHALGLPDLYDRTPRPPDDPDSHGIGNWCLMAGGSYGGDGNHPDTPASMSAWCKQYLGWANVQTVTSAGEIALEAVEDRNRLYRIDVPGTNGKEYFLIEYRHAGWKDSSGSRINWDTYLPASGLAIWHVDENVGKLIETETPAVENENWPFALDDQGQNDSPTLPTGDNTAYQKKHSLVALVEADGELKLAKGRSNGEAGDLWITGLSFDDDPTFVRGSRAYDGRKTSIALTAINLGGYTAIAQNASGISTPQEIISPIKGQPTSAIASKEAASSEKPAPSATIGTGITSRPAAPRTSNTSSTSTGIAQPSTTVKPAVGQSGTTHPSGSAPPTLADRLAAVNSIEPERAKPLFNVNRLLNRAEVELSDIQGMAGKKSLATSLNQELEKQGIEKISAGDLAKIAKAKPAEIQQAVEPDNRPLVQALGAESRTKELSSSAKPSNLPESNIVKLMQEAKQKEPVQIQFAPEGNRLERVTDLSVPTKAPDIVTDAKARITQELQDVIGKGIQLESKAKPALKSSSGTVAQFEQVVQSDHKPLPVFGTETALYYSKKAVSKLIAITNKTVSAEALKVAGVAGELSVNDAKAIVAEQLKVDLQLLRDGIEGVYLVGDNPKNARVAVMVPVKVDEHHEDINVFVDSETKEILDIK